MASWFRAYERMELAIGRETTPFQDLGPDMQAAWQYAFTECQNAVHNADGSTISVLAANVNLAFQRALHGDQQELIATWDDLSPVDRLIWEHLVRHMANLFSFDAEEDGGLDSHEERIALRFQGKVQDLGTPEAHVAARIEAANG